jgi:transglycosylase-like protein with SLT domain
MTSHAADTARRAGFVASALAVIAFSAVPARAELVYLSSGRSLSVKAHRVEGELLILSLRSGGEIVCDAALVTRIEPDEVPYPEEVVVEADAVPDAQSGTDLTQADPAGSRYEPMIRRLAAEQGVDAKLVRAVIQVESGYQPRARSSRGAMGLMQLMPATARHYGIRNPYDPASNIEAGIKHLRSLLERFPLALALAAYNAGEAAVQRFGGIPPYPETRFYISRILKLTGR